MPGSSREERAVSWILLVGGLVVFSGLAIPIFHGQAPWEEIYRVLTKASRNTDDVMSVLLLAAPHLAGLALAIRQGINLVRNEESIELGVVASIGAGGGLLGMILLMVSEFGRLAGGVAAWTALPLGLPLVLGVYGFLRAGKQALFDLVECQGIACILWWAGFMAFRLREVDDREPTDMLWSNVLLGIAVILAGAAIVREVMRRPAGRE